MRSRVRVSQRPPLKNSAAHLSGFNFLMVERSRKASLHAFCVLPHQRQSQKLFTQKTKVFLHIFTKSPKPCLWSRSATGLVPCVPQAQFVIASLVKRSAPLPVKFLPGGSKVGDVITARLRRLNFPYTLPNAIFNVCFLSFSILGSRPRPKLLVSRRRTWFSEIHTFAMQIIKLPTLLRISRQKLADCYIGRLWMQ